MSERYVSPLFVRFVYSTVDHRQNRTRQLVPRSRPLLGGWTNRNWRNRRAGIWRMLAKMP